MAKVKKNIPNKKDVASKRAAAPVSVTSRVLPAARLKVMVSSSVYRVTTEVHQICGILTTYGYDVLNSEIGTIYPPLTPNDSILQACLEAVEQCDIFLGIITPYYGHFRIYPQGISEGH